MFSRTRKHKGDSESKTVLWKPITTNSPYGGARIAPLSPAGRVSEMLSPKLCHATTASPNGPIEPKPPKGSTDASQSKAVPKFIVIPMKVQNPRFQSKRNRGFFMLKIISNRTHNGFGLFYVRKNEDWEDWIKSILLRKWIDEVYISIYTKIKMWCFVWED